MTLRTDLEGLHHAEQRLVRTVDSLTAPEFGRPSLLPGWSRAHVVAHLALNAEGFSRALAGVRHGEMVPIYDSNNSRDADIDTLAAAGPDEIRERLFAAGQHLRDLFGSLSDDDWAGTVLRVPEGPEWPTASLVVTRWREVEIHHADLGAGYTHLDWPTTFAVGLLAQATIDHHDSTESPAFAVRASDLDREWTLGAAEPVVTGPATGLGWWLVGRGRGEGLTAAAGRLPELVPWRRSPRS